MYARNIFAAGRCFGGVFRGSLLFTIAKKYIFGPTFQLLF